MDISNGFKKAIETGALARVEEVGVASAAPAGRAFCFDGGRYEVATFDTMDGRIVTACTCPAGTHHRTCYHAAAVVLLILAERTTAAERQIAESRKAA